eukprot:TRINITY_DN4432_c0_g1_i1.p1 TRINITY_DN4432_c0_g1~~TRINITY_DN4432_c0_g1_i1.p1  ORF type:complete len:409 (+),score=19.37 TRINITY_DN4432_c0_g1_i1:107-1333(+)
MSSRETNMTIPNTWHIPGSGVVLYMLVVLVLFMLLSETKAINPNDDDGQARLDVERVDEALDDIEIMETGVEATTSILLPATDQFSNSTLYYDLSCPFEWKQWSCGMINHIDTAQRSLAYARSHGVDGAIAAMVASGSFKGKRLFLMGDSISRQLFVAIACATYNEQSERSISGDLAPQNVSANAPHKGFTLGSLKWKGGGELHLIPVDVRSENDIPASKRNDPYFVARLLKELAVNGTMSMRPGMACIPPTGGLTLRKGDVLLLNPAGLHYNNKPDDYKAALEEIATLGTQMRGLPELHRPKLIFVTSATQHFRSDTGLYNFVEVHSRPDIITCRSRVPSSPRADFELDIIKPGVNVDAALVWGAFDLGGLHIGPSETMHMLDCTHYCLPGVPDEVAVRLMQAAAQV